MLENMEIEIGQNTEKISAGLQKLTISKIQMKDHQLTLVWKNLLGVLEKNFHTSNEKRQTTPDSRNETTKSRQN